MSMVWDFFRMLGVGKVNAAKGRMDGKAMGIQAKVKGKIANSFNSAVDGGVQKAKGKATAGGGKSKKAKKGKDGMFGLFGKGKKGAADAQGAAEEDFVDDKTAMVDISMLTDERTQDVVGWVVPMSGAQRGQDFRLVTGKNISGTSADCDIVLTDAYMSGRHATIRHEDDAFMLIDLDSTNGTYVNDKRIAKQEIFDNDTLRFGKVEMRFKSLN
jgi:hypothetical protein